MTFDSVIMLIVLLLSIVGLIRVLIGPTIWDRMLGYSVFSSKMIVLAVLTSVIIRRTYIMDVAIVYGVLGFIGTIMIARTIEKRGDI